MDYAISKDGCCTICVYELELLLGQILIFTKHDSRVFACNIYSALTLVFGNITV